MVHHAHEHPGKLVSGKVSQQGENDSGPPILSCTKEPLKSHYGPQSQPTVWGGAGLGF